MPLTSILGRACCCGGSGISMNFGFSGPMADSEVVEVKVRMGIEIFEHLHRANELNELLGNDGGILSQARVGLNAQFKMSKLKPLLLLERANL